MLSTPELPNTAFIQHTISVPFPIERVFGFFIKNNLSKIYTEIAKGHYYYILREGSELKIGSIIDCGESAGNQFITHEYHVTDIIANERIAYSSKPSHSITKILWQLIESRSDTYVYYDFEKNNESKTSIRLTIGIQFPNKFEKIMATLFGGLTP